MNLKTVKLKNWKKILLHICWSRKKVSSCKICQVYKYKKKNRYCQQSRNQGLTCPSSVFLDGRTSQIICPDLNIEIITFDLNSLILFSLQTHIFCCTTGLKHSVFSISDYLFFSWTSMVSLNFQILLHTESDFGFLWYQEYYLQLPWFSFWLLFI